MDISNIIIEKALNIVKSIPNKGKVDDANTIYNLALLSFRTACNEYEDEHPEISNLSDEDDQTMWWDSMLDEGIIEAIIEKIVDEFQ